MTTVQQQQAAQRRAEADRICDLLTPVAYVFSSKSQDFLRQIASTRYPVTERQLAWLRDLKEQFVSL